jgi:hypothetical protein
MNKTKSTPEARRKKTAKLLEIALGPQWRTALARGLHMPASSVSRMFNPPKGRSDAPSETMLALAELLAGSKTNRWKDTRK